MGWTIGYDRSTTTIDIRSASTSVNSKGKQWQTTTVQSAHYRAAFRATSEEFQWMCTSNGTPPLAIDWRSGFWSHQSHCGIRIEQLSFENTVSPENCNFFTSRRWIIPRSPCTSYRIIQNLTQKKTPKHQIAIQTGRAIANDWSAHWRKLHFKCGTSAARRTTHSTRRRSMALTQNWCSAWSRLNKISANRRRDAFPRSSPLLNNRNQNKQLENVCFLTVSAVGERESIRARGAVLAIKS